MSGIRSTLPTQHSLTKEELAIHKHPHVLGDLPRWVLGFSSCEHDDFGTAVRERGVCEGAKSQPRASFDTHKKKPRKRPRAPLMP